MSLSNKPSSALVSAADFFNIPNLNEDSFHFNYLADSLNRENIREFLNIDLNQDNPIQNLNKNNLEMLMNWFFRRVDPKPKGYSNKNTKLIADSKSLTDLDLVLGNEKAKKVFVEEDRSLPEAKEFTGEIENNFIDYLENAKYYLEQADDVIIKIEKFDENFKERMRNSN